MDITKDVIKRQNWFEANGDETLALDWPMTPDSQVMEIGGFEGRWAAQMAENFDCRVDIFEPQIWAVERMIMRFAENPKIVIHPYGLWLQPGNFPLSNAFTDGATLMGAEERPVILGRFEYYQAELDKFQGDIDVGLMNIEGAEYMLLPAMIANGQMERFRYFWCQFHTGFELYEGQSDKIMENMFHTHDLLWDCFPTAVAWRRKVVA